jgi:outer membrane receptor protein involved in Fe transport
MNHFFTTLLIGLASLFVLVPVSAAESNTGTLTGIIQDAVSQAPIDYVHVVLFKDGNTVPLKSVSSSENGAFRFDNLQAGNYRLEASLLGYQALKQTCTVKTGQPTDLGTLHLQPDAKQLAAAEVRGIRSAMRMDIDKRVFSVDQNIASAGASASDVLKDIPSVDVDQEGAVSLRNSSNVTIWINGKPAGLNSDNQAQVLEQMPAESIDKIEVVTNPSSKFSAEGTAGIINIVLKKDRKAGYYGSVRAGVSHPFGYDYGANLMYSSSKIDAYTTLGRRRHSNQGTGNSRRETYTSNPLTLLTDTSTLLSDTEQDFNMGGLFFRGGVDYHLNNKHTLSLSGFAMTGERGFDSQIDYDYRLPDGSSSRFVDRTSGSLGNHTNLEVTLDYQWEIEEDHRFQTNLSFGKRAMNDNSDFAQTETRGDGTPVAPTFQRQTGDGGHTDWEFQADYTNQLNERFRLEAGLKSDWTVRGSGNDIFNTAIPTVGQWPDYSSQFDYDEKIHAAYATFTGKGWGGFGYQLGLRGEYSDIAFHSATMPSGDQLDKHKYYADLFPSVFLSYTLREGFDVQLNYSRRINRPRGRSLNPFTDISDSTNIRFGNPNLAPEYANAFEINLIRVLENHTLSASAYHRLSSSVIQDIRYLNQGILYQTPANVTTSTSSGLELVAKDRLSKWLETTSTVNLYHTRLNGFTYRGSDYKGSEGFSWNARVNGTLLLSRSLTGQISGFYNAPRIMAQGRMNSNFRVDAGLRQSFMDRSLLIALNARNLLNSFNFSSSSYGPGFYQESHNQFFGRTLQLTVTWNFGNMKPKQKKPNGENGNREDGIDSGLEGGMDGGMGGSF